MDDIVTIMAFLTRKQHHHLTLASQATTSEEQFIQEDEAKRYATAAASLRELVEENARLEKQYRERRDVPMENIARIAAKPAKAKGVGCD